MLTGKKTILLLYADKYYLVNPVYPFGLDIIANHLRNLGHRVEIELPFLPDLDYKKNVSNVISQFRPDFVGLSIRNIDTCMSCEQYGDWRGKDYRTFYFLPQIQEVASQIRRQSPNIPVVVGGGAFTASPQAILECLGLDYGIVGEGEIPFSRFIETFPDKEKISQIPNMVYPCKSGYKVNSQRPYRFESSFWLKQRDRKFNYACRTTGIPVQAKRGCHHKCSYCIEPLIEGREFIFRKIDDVIHELKVIVRGMEEAGTVFFVDTEFNVPNLSYCSDLVRAIVQEGLGDCCRFVTQLIPKPLDENFVELLAEAGFFVVFSCESFSNEVLRKNYIPYRKKDIIEAIEICDRKGLPCTISLIFGLPGETRETMEDTLTNMATYPASPTRKYEYTVGGRVYQGTPLCEYVEKGNQPENLYGTKSDGYLLPYYYCAPLSPFKVRDYVKEKFPDLLCYDNKYEHNNQHGLALCYLCDQALWKDVVQGFGESDVDVQSASYDYLFKQLAQAERTNDARAISTAFLTNLENNGPADPGQADVVRFYLGCL